MCECVCVCWEHTEWAFIFRAFQCRKSASRFGPFTNPSLRTKHSSSANITICYLKQVTQSVIMQVGAKTWPLGGLKEEDVLAWLITAIYWLGDWTQLCIDNVNTAVLSNHKNIGGLIQTRKHTLAQANKHTHTYTHTQMWILIYRMMNL